MTATCAYWSPNRVVLAAWSEWKAADAAFSAEAEAFRDEFPGEDRGVLIAQSFGERSVAGLSGSQPSERWRRTAHGWVPSRKTAASRALDDRMRSIKVGAPVLPGMPKRVIFEGRMFWPGIREMGGDLWVTWGTPPEAAFDVNPSLWVRKLMSAYWLAVETADAEQGQPDVAASVKS